jgi:AraC-like DNA-binding protein
MARAHHHGGGQKSALSLRYRGEHRDATPRTATIQAYCDRALAQTGLLPSIEQVAKDLCMAPTQVERHYRILGLI